MSEIMTKILPIISPIAEFAYLLGSAETPRFRPDSDVDLAFYPKKKMDDKQVLNIKLQLEAVLSRDVDLILVDVIDPVFGRQILETGRLIVVNDPGTHLAWKARQLSVYPDFKRSRLIIEKNLLKRKKYV